jgi:hypothetical protein
VYNSFKDTEENLGEKQRMEKLATFKDGLDSMNFTATLKDEQPAKMELTCSMVGGVEWGLLTKKNNTVPLMLAEPMARGFKADDLEELKRTDDVVKLRAMLKQHEWEHQVKTKLGTKLSDVKNLKPISEEMMSFLPVVACIRNKKLCPDNDNELFE